MGIKACLGIAAFILVFGVIMAVQYKDWTNFLIMAGSDAVFLLITFVVFKLALSAEDPQESYEMSDIYVKSGYGRSSVYFDFDKAKAAVFTPQKRPSLRQNISNFKMESRSSASLCRKRTTIL